MENKLLIDTALMSVTGIYFICGYLFCKDKMYGLGISYICYGFANVAIMFAARGL